MTAVAVRRRRVHSGHAFRFAAFGPAVLGPPAAWAYLGEPALWAARGGAYPYDGLIALAAAGLLAWPALAVHAAFLASGGWPALAPRRCRKWYRGRKSRRPRRQAESYRETAHSARISDRDRGIIFRADRYRCLHCRRRFPARLLQVDHWIAWAQGGLSVLKNFATLCGPCNVAKLDYQPGQPSHLFTGESLHRARAVWAAERRAIRWSPARYWRLAWAMGS